MRRLGKIIRFTAMMVGTLAILLAIGWFALFVLIRRACMSPVLQEVTTDDKSVKASIYVTDCGAMTAQRVNIALSAWYVDARQYGDTVVTVLHISADKVRITWRTRRDLVVEYPAYGDVEYAVSKVRGVKIRLEPQ